MIVSTILPLFCVFFRSTNYVIWRKKVEAGSKSTPNYQKTTKCLSRKLLKTITTLGHKVSWTRTAGNYVQNNQWDEFRQMTSHCYQYHNKQNPNLLTLVLFCSEKRPFTQIMPITTSIIPISTSMVIFWCHMPLISFGDELDQEESNQRSSSFKVSFC